MKAQNSKEFVAEIIASTPVVEPTISFATTLFSSPQLTYLFVRAKRIMKVQVLGSAILWIEYGIFLYWLEIPFITTLIHLLALVALWNAFQWGALENTRRHFQDLWNSGQRLKARKEMVNFLRQSIGFSIVPFFGILCLCFVDILVFHRQWNFMHTLIVGLAVKAALQTWARSVVSSFSVIRRTWQAPLLGFSIELLLLGMVAAVASNFGDHVVGVYYAISGITLAILTYRNFKQTLRVLRLPASVIFSTKIQSPKNLSFLPRGILGIAVNPDGLFLFMGNMAHPAVGGLFYLLTPVIRLIQGLSRYLYIELLTINFSCFRPLRINFLRNWVWIFLTISVPTFLIFYLSILQLNEESVKLILLFFFRMFWAAFGVFVYLALSGRYGVKKMSFSPSPLENGVPPQWRWTLAGGMQTSLPQKERQEFEHALWNSLKIWAAKGKRGRVRGYRVWLKSKNGDVLDEIAAWSVKKPIK